MFLAAWACLKPIVGLIVGHHINRHDRRFAGRMPVIVDPADYGDCLAGEQIALVPFTAD